MINGIILSKKGWSVPAMAWLCGPPCSPGNTAWLIRDSKLYIISFPLASTLRTPAGEKPGKKSTGCGKKMSIPWLVWKEDTFLHWYLSCRKWCLSGSRGASCVLLWTRCRCAQRVMAQLQQLPDRWCVPCLTSDMRRSHSRSASCEHNQGCENSNLFLGWGGD